MGYKKSVFRTFALITQLGLSMLTPIFLCVFLARFLQNTFEVSVFLPLLILGILAGGRNTFILAKSAVEEPDNKDDD